MNTRRFLLLSIASLIAAIASAPGDASSQTTIETAISHLQYRELGPALMGGRIADLAVVESKPQVFYIATGTGGVWKTENHGTSWTPLFDDQPTGSIGDVTLDQSNPTSSGSAPASRRTASHPAGATASTSPPTPETPGATWGWRGRSTSGAS